MLFMNLWCRIVGLLSLPIVLREYFLSETGKDYGVGMIKKLALLHRMVRNRSRIPTASTWREHLTMAAKILRLPSSLAGCVVECGSFKGGSAANLSLVCALTNRRLEIFDSFAGLPTPSLADEKHTVLAAREIPTYAQGAFSGSLAEVRDNISHWGETKVCSFHQGYFNETLPGFKSPCVLVFLDVDLTDSLRDCLLHLWPLLHDGCFLFTHEAPHQEIGAVFFDTEWWASNLGCSAPGLIGAGIGLPLHATDSGFGSCLGYAIKSPQLAEFSIHPQQSSLASSFKADLPSE